MKLDKTLQDAIEREYSYIQNNAIREYKQKIKEIYESHPRLDDMIKRLKKLYVKKAKEKVLNRDLSLGNEIEILKHEIKNYIDLYNINLPSEYACNKCKDTGYTNDGKYCSCYNSVFRKVVYKDNEYNNYFNKCTFENIDYSLYDNNRINDGLPSNRESVEYISKQAVKLAEDISNGVRPKFQNFLIIGNVGVGKTFISIAIANEFIKRNQYVRFLSATELADILTSFDNDKYEEYLRLKDIPLLVIDDLGVEYHRSNYISRLFEILNYRQMNKLPMVITSNLTAKDIIDVYTERFWSKLQQDTRVYSIIGKDLRHS